MDVDQLLECLPGIYKALGLSPSMASIRVIAHACNASTGRKKQKDRKLNSILSYSILRNTKPCLRKKRSGELGLHLPSACLSDSWVPQAGKHLFLRFLDTAIKSLLSPDTGNLIVLPPPPCPKKERK